MRHFTKIGLRPWGICLLTITLLLLLAVACGSAAQPAAESPPVQQPAVVEPISVAPTAVAQPAEPSQNVIIHPGKLTWMIAGWGNERFSYNFGVGGGNNYARIFQGFLIATNEKAELIPGIATDWEISSDGTTWTVTVRDGVRFHDGKELTAEDVWWSWMHYFGKDESGSAVERVTQSSAQALGRITEKIEQPAPNQVRITTTVPDTGFAGGMISEAAANWYGVLPKRPLVHSAAQEEAYDLKPVSAGPMRLVRHVPAELMAFERFEDYYYQPDNGLPEDRRVKFQSLDMFLVPEEATRVSALRAGEADIAPVSLNARPQVEAADGRIVFGPEGIYISAFALGCYREQFPCHDQRVRQALNYAIDKEIIRDQLFGGPEVFQVKGWSHVTPNSLGYSPELDPFPYDPDKARQLLAEAGYPGGRGFGKFIVNTWVSTAMPFLPESAQLAAEFWKRELGLDVEVRVGDEATLKRQALTEELFGQMRWADNEARWDGGSIVRSSYGTPTHAGRRHESQALFELVNQTQGVIDPEDRAVAYNELYRRLRDEQYHLGIGYVNIPWAVGPRVQTWQPWPFSFYPSNLHGITLK